MKASQQEGSFQVNFSLIFPYPVTTTCAVFSNSFIINSDGHPRMMSAWCFCLETRGQPISLEFWTTLYCVEFPINGTHSPCHILKLSMKPLSHYEAPHLTCPIKRDLKVLHNNFLLIKSFPHGQRLLSLRT